MLTHGETMKVNENVPDPISKDSSIASEFGSELLDFLDSRYTQGCHGVRCGECALKEFQHLCAELDVRMPRSPQTPSEDEKKLRILKADSALHPIMEVA